MLSVIIDARPGTDRLPALLAQLTAGAVDGLVRQVLIVARPDQAGIDLLCEETGAAAHPTIAAGARAARADRVMVLPADFRLRDGWLGALDAHMAQGGAAALVGGFAQGGGLFARAPTGVLVERRLLEQVADGVGVGGLRRLLRLGGRRIG
jgi:hypothetical protein